MKYSKIFHIAYLVFAVLFIYDGVSKWNKDPGQAYLSLALAGLAIFMYFFRTKFRKKYQDKDNSN
ncbi:hypothetical protein Q4566_09150 [Tamlana sp. 2_MG-2023]|uniref:hypothetical protein n=1 Tax=unclassified Tamlana TaxID=2614803 RepID=UPI0026E46A59|nr:MULTISPECIES: hypothetical protein [unclassified Tamlana]MDO6760362.1 hypothetical protein [Tamlana sp. 2_MG-2023]MDO6789940.1 hypothetical protein [Tamlana sp. 1_MG-2023]